MLILVLFFPFRERITKVIYDYLLKKNKEDFNPFNVVFYSHVYQILYFLDGDKSKAKDYFNQNPTKFQEIPKELLIFYPDSFLQDFIDSIPLSNRGRTIFTGDQSIYTLIKSLDLSHLKNWYEVVRDIFAEVLAYSHNVSSIQEKRILLSFVSNFEHFLAIVRQLVPSTFQNKISEVLGIMPENSQDALRQYNKYIYSHAGMQCKCVHLTFS
jgi:hypothetical protein